MMVLDSKTVMELHDLLTRETGGSPELRDAGLLESALSSVYQTFGGVELYPTTEEKGARLGFALISNHAFVDGNKRIGMLVMLLYLELCGKPLETSNDEFIRIGLGVASGEVSYEKLLEWVKSSVK